MTYGAEPARGVLRVVRGTVPAAASAALAIAAHVAGGGHAPHAGTICVATAAVALIGSAMAGRCRSLWEMLVTVGMSHLLLHELMTLPHDSSPGGSMLLTHLGGVVVTTLLLSRAEYAIFTLASALRTLLPPPTVAFVPVTVACSTVAYSSADLLDPRLRRLMVGAIARRGPPDSAG